MRRSLASLLAATVAALPLTGLAQTPTPAPEQPTQGTPTPAPEQPSQAAPTPSAVPAPAPAAPSKVTFNPYGFILANAFMNAHAFSNDDYPQYAVNPGATTDRGLLLSSRYNRIGVKIGLARRRAGAKLNAVIEADFGFAAGQNVQQSTQAGNFDFYKPIARMRLGYVTATWGDADAKFSLLTGSTTKLVEPALRGDARVHRPALPERR